MCRFFLSRLSHAPSQVPGRGRASPGYRKVYALRLQPLLKRVAAQRAETGRPRAASQTARVVALRSSNKLQLDTVRWDAAHCAALLRESRQRVGSCSRIGLRFLSKTNCTFHHHRCCRRLETCAIPAKLAPEGLQFLHSTYPPQLLPTQTQGHFLFRPWQHGIRFRFRFSLPQ